MAIASAYLTGFSYHFDIMAQSEVFGDNPVVEVEPVACPGQATSDFEQCVCSGMTANDTTPAGLSAAASLSDDMAESDNVSSSSSTGPAATVATDPTSTAQDPPEDPTSTAQDPATDPTSTTQDPAADPTSATETTADPTTTASTSDPPTSTSADPALATSSTVTIDLLNSTVANATTKVPNTTLSATAQPTARMVLASGAKIFDVDQLIPFTVGMLALTLLL